MIDSADISVVVQGPVNYEQTKECLKSIRKFLPKSEIILSTWENSKTEGLDFDVLILNKDPGGVRCMFAVYDLSRCTNNFNRQLVSTADGIKKASRSYILKLRTDLILLSSNFLRYWDCFTVRNDKFKIFEHRVLCCTLYSREYSCQYGTGYPVPFHVSDFWFFGRKVDLVSYIVDCPLQGKNESSLWQYKYPTRLPYITFTWRFAPEQFFCVNWAKKYYPSLRFEDWSDWNPENIELSNDVLYNNFIFLEYSQSGIYSSKHSWAFENSNKIQGLITFHRFEEQYKNLCDNKYNITQDRKNPLLEVKLKKHLTAFASPVHKFFSWLGEPFSVVYYLIRIGIRQLLSLGH